MKNNYINFVFLIFINFFISNQSMHQSTEGLYFGYYNNLSTNRIIKEEYNVFGKYNERYQFKLDDNLYKESKFDKAIFILINLCAIPTKSLRFVLTSLFATGIFEIAMYFYHKEFNKKVFFGGIIGGGAISILSYLAKKSIDKSQKITRQSYNFFYWIKNNHKKGDRNIQSKIIDLANTCLNKNKIKRDNSLNQLFNIYLKQYSDDEPNQKSIIDYVTNRIDCKEIDINEMFY